MVSQVSEQVTDEEKEHIIGILDESVQALRDNARRNSELADKLEQKLGELVGV